MAFALRHSLFGSLHRGVVQPIVSVAPTFVPAKIKTAKEVHHDNWQAQYQRLLMSLERDVLYPGEQATNSSKCYAVPADALEKFKDLYSRTDCSNVKAVVVPIMWATGFGYSLEKFSDAAVHLLERGQQFFLGDFPWGYATCAQGTTACTWIAPGFCHREDIPWRNLCTRHTGYPEDHWLDCFGGPPIRHVTIQMKAALRHRFLARSLFSLSADLQQKLEGAKATIGWPEHGTVAAIHIRQGQREGHDHVRVGKRRWSAEWAAAAAAAVAIKWKCSAVLLVSDDHNLTSAVEQLSKTWAIADFSSSSSTSSSSGAPSLPRVLTTAQFAGGSVGVDCVREKRLQTPECKNATVRQQHALSAMVDFYLPTMAQHFAGTMGSEFSRSICNYMREEGAPLDLDALKCSGDQPHGETRGRGGGRGGGGVGQGRGEGGGARRERRQGREEKANGEMGVGGAQHCVIPPWAYYNGSCAVPAPASCCVRLQGSSLTVCV